MVCRKVYLFLVLFLAVSVCAAEFEDFERSLMQPDTTVTSGKPDTGSSATYNAFEQSLLQEESSEMSLAYRGREALMQAIKSRDTAAISQRIAELDNMKSGNVAPLVNIEKECIYIDNQMWRQMLELEVSYYKNFYDSLETEYVQYPENDELMFYVKKIVGKFDTNLTMYRNISYYIEHARMDQADKMELVIMLLLRSAYTRFEDYKLLAEMGRDFCNKYPKHPDAEWIKKSVLAPAERTNFRNLYRENKVNRFDTRAEHKEENIAKNLYTGGVGTNVFLLSGGLAFGDDLYRSDLFEVEELAVALEFYLQLKRFAFAAELLSSGMTGVASYSLGLGYVVFDSRYLKVRPYVAYCFPTMIIEAKKNVLVPERLYSEHGYMEDGDNGQFMGDLGLTFAVNVDFRFLTAYLFRAVNHFFGMSLVGKFGVSYISFDDAPYVDGANVSPFFSLGLGVYFW